MRINKTSYKSTTIDDYNTIIDVRTPLEFDEDHIPRSVNYPVLTNKQRHEIGLKYRENSFLAKKEGASIISANISKIINKIKFDKKNKTLIYCWRGGLRSLSLYLVLKQIGYDVTLLEGGYKTYRGYVVDFFEIKTIDLTIWYGITILCFLSGVYWGLSINILIKNNSKLNYLLPALSIIPFMFAIIAVIVSNYLNIIFLVVGFLICQILDEILFQA